MRRILISLIAVGIMAGCSSEKPEKTKPVVQEKVVDEQQNEDNFISAVTDSSNLIIENVAGLKSLTNEINITDESWKLDVSEKTLNIQSAANNYTESKLSLSDNQKKKYKTTKAYFDEGIMYLDQYVKDIDQAIENSDESSLKEISTKIDQASLLILKASKEIETERGKK